MSKLIGEALVANGIVSSRQLTQGLQQQLIMGGTLGTCLIELGLADEAAIGRTLSEILNVPFAGSEVLADIAPEVIDLVPSSLVRKRRVVPFEVEGRSLHLAVVNPRDLANLSTATGYRVVPYVTPEIRLVEAMEKYYGIARPLRYVHVSRRLERKQLHPEASVEPPRSAPPVTELSELPAELQDLCERMGRVDSHVELGDVLLGHLSRYMDRCVLFEVTGGSASVANWKGVGMDDADLRGRKLPLTTDSMFRLILEDSIYRGPVPEGAESRSFYEALGLDMPGECLFLPIYGDRLEAIAYADASDRGRMPGSLEAYQVLLDRVALAVRMLSLKQQLCGTA